MTTGQEIIIDLRAPEEFAAGHIEGAVNIPAMMEPMTPEGRMALWRNLSAAFASVPRETPIYTYCREGNRAQTANSMLHQLGFQHVGNLGGPNRGWISEMLRQGRIKFVR